MIWLYIGILLAGVVFGILMASMFSANDRNGHIIHIYADEDGHIIKTIHDVHDIVIIHKENQDDQKDEIL